MLVLSYQHEYKIGREGYDCSNFNALIMGLACNHNTSYEQTGVTNQTACDDGFVGWKQWCAKYFLSNVFPGRLANNQTYVAMCLKTGADNAHVLIMYCHH